jgi:hypothetical protein
MRCGWIGEEVQSRITGPEIVDRRDEAELLVGLQDALQVRVVDDALAFGDFEHDAIGGKTVLGGGLERRADARLGTIDRVRQEVDAEHPIEPEPRREVDRLDAACLIEAVAVAVVDLAEYVSGALSF